MGAWRFAGEGRVRRARFVALVASLSSSPQRAHAEPPSDSGTSSHAELAWVVATPDLRAGARSLRGGGPTSLPALDARAFRDTGLENRLLLGAASASPGSWSNISTRARLRLSLDLSQLGSSAAPGLGDAGSDVEVVVRASARS